MPGDSDDDARDGSSFSSSASIVSADIIPEPVLPAAPLDLEPSIGRWASPTQLGRQLEIASRASGQSFSAVTPHPHDSADPRDDGCSPDVEDIWWEGVSSVGSEAPRVDESTRRAEGARGRGIQLARIALRFRRTSVRTLLAECGTVVGVAALMSLASFGFVAVYFGYFLRLPSSDEALLEAYGDWTACYNGSSARPAVTVLGHAYSWPAVRALVSLPKMFSVAALMVLGSYAWLGRTAFSHAIAGVVLAVLSAAVLLYTLLPRRGGQIPMSVDPTITVGIIMGHALVMTRVARSRRSSHWIVALCPRVMYVVAFSLLFLLKTFLTHAMTLMVKHNANPGIIVLACILFLRAVGLAARTILRNLTIPLIVCLMVLFAFDVSMAVALRRYWLALPAFSDVALSAIVSAMLELCFSMLSAAFAIQGYNSYLKLGNAEMASVQLNLFFTAIISELVAEQVALHSCLGYILFLDSRVLAVDMPADSSRAVAAWGVSALAEIVVDGAVLVPLVFFLPVSFQSLFGTYFRSWTPALFMVVACMFPHLVGLHSYLDRRRYFCD